jgi:hypothetical protein
MTLLSIGVAATALSKLAAYAPGLQDLGVEVRLHYIGNDVFTAERWDPVCRDIESADFILLDLMGVPKDFCEFLADALGGYTGNIVVLNSSVSAMRALTRLGSFSMKGMGTRRKDAAEPGSIDGMRRMIDTM